MTDLLAWLLAMGTGGSLLAALQAYRYLRAQARKDTLEEHRSWMVEDAKKYLQTKHKAPAQLEKSPKSVPDTDPSGKPYGARPTDGVYATGTCRDCYMQDQVIDSLQRCAPCAELHLLVTVERPPDVIERLIEDLDADDKQDPWRDLSTVAKILGVSRQRVMRLSQKFYLTVNRVNHETFFRTSEIPILQRAVADEDNSSKSDKFLPQWHADQCPGPHLSTVDGLLACHASADEQRLAQQVWISKHKGVALLNEARISRAINKPTGLTGPDGIRGVDGIGGGV